MNVLEWVFGKRETPAEALRKQVRFVDKAIREIEQVRTKMERQEKTLIPQIRQSAEKGQMGACKIQAEDLIRTRRYIERTMGVKVLLQKLSLRLQTHRTNEQLMSAMKGATRALGSMNRSINLPELQRITLDFERQSDLMEQKQEIMDDAVDDAMDIGVEEESNEMVERVLEEIGVDLKSRLLDAPTGPPTDIVSRSKVAQAVGGDGGDGGDGDIGEDDLQARLDSLRK